MKIMFKILGAAAVLIGLGIAGNQINHQTPKPVQPTGQVQQSTTTQTNGKNNTEIVLRDVKYGTDARNTMNVFIPKGATSTTPFILFMHGGAWISGDKNDVAIVQLALGAQGIASASINYRYASKTVHYAELMSDVNTAVNYINDHGKDWNVDTSKIAIGGISAGAHMAMLYAYQYDNANRIDAVISMAGPTNLADPTVLDASVKNKLIGGVENMVGAKYIAGKPLDQKFTNSSPINRVKNVPTLLIHGTGDTIVAYDQSVKMDAALAAAGVPHKLMSITGANHDLGFGNPTTAKQIADEVVKWIKKYEK